MGRFTARYGVTFTIPDMEIDVGALDETLYVSASGDEFRAEYDMYDDRGHISCIIDYKTVERKESSKAGESWHPDRVSNRIIMEIENFLVAVHERENQRIRDMAREDAA